MDVIQYTLHDAYIHDTCDTRVAHSVQSRNKNRKSDTVYTGTRSIYANYRNKIFCNKSLELNNI